MKRIIPGVVVILLSSAVLAGSSSFAERVTMGMEGQHRSDANIARNQYRHPVQTLEFFGIKDGMTVMEIWPGGGWYIPGTARIILKGSGPCRQVLGSVMKKRQNMPRLAKVIA